MKLAAPELDTVRGEVRRILERSPAFHALGPEDRRRFAGDMVKVSSFLADPAWLEGKPPPAARALADPVDALKERLAQKPGQIGKEFEAGATRQGVEQFGELVKKVDFPEFVSGLIQGVFQAIVDASMQQMKAYGELLAAAAKSTSQFADDHITDAQARDFVMNRNPSKLKLATGEGGGQKLALASEDGDTSELTRLVPGAGNVDLSSDEGEAAFVGAAKLEMARQRQQTMALMVLLGINRIVVTNGRINAKVVFDMRASDTAKRMAKAELQDTAKSESAAGGGFITPWGGGAGYSSTSHVATVSSAVDDTSESKAQVKAQLSGDVHVNFKSETFPLDKMMAPAQIDQLTSVANPGRGAPAAPAPARIAPTAPAPPAPTVSPAAGAHP